MQHGITRIVRYVASMPWAILPEKLEAIKALLYLRAAGGRVSDEEIKAITMEAAARPSPRTAGMVAIIPIYGLISQRTNMLSQFSGGTSTESVSKQLNQCLADPNVKAIVFDVDSPGGAVNGVDELSSQIYKARGQKKMVAVVNSLCASAAYWIACAADEVVITPSGLAGSIGVYLLHEDDSAAEEAAGIKTTVISAGKYKAEAVPGMPLTDEARQALQEMVDTMYGMFVSSVARNRGVSVSDVRNGYGQGRVLLAKEAVAQNLCDKVATFDQTLARFGVTGAVQQVAAEAALPEIDAAIESHKTVPSSIALRRRKLDLVVTQ
jgi:signal peptide peptidase SppA